MSEQMSALTRLYWSMNERRWLQLWLLRKFNIGIDGAFTSCACRKSYTLPHCPLARFINLQRTQVHASIVLPFSSCSRSAGVCHLLQDAVVFIRHYTLLHCEGKWLLFSTVLYTCDSLTFNLLQSKYTYLLGGDQWQNTLHPLVQRDLQEKVLPFQVCVCVGGGGWVGGGVRGADIANCDSC